MSERCPFHSRAYNVRCELPRGHDGACVHEGDMFRPGYDPTEDIDAIRTERDALATEVERLALRATLLPGQLAAMAARADCFEAERDTARARVAELERALDLHGEHFTTCAKLVDSRYECSCGYDAALAGTKENGE